MAKPPTPKPLTPDLELHEGHPAGRDPRKMTSVELKRARHMPGSLLDIVRGKCVDCCGGCLGEIRRCPATRYALWPYRMQTNPWLPAPSLAQRRQRAAALERAAEQKTSGRPGEKLRERTPAMRNTLTRLP